MTGYTPRERRATARAALIDPVTVEETLELAHERTCPLAGSGSSHIAVGEAAAAGKVDVDPHRVRGAVGEVRDDL